jgi:hypothetical protein
MNLRIFSVALAGVAALGLGACQQRAATNNSATANDSGGIIDTHDNGTMVINTSAAQSTLQNVAHDAGNLASQAGDVIQNEVREIGQDINDANRGDRPTNTSGR